MASGSARTATGVTVSIAPDPALVRTVRLIAAAVARRTERDEDFVEEVRLAVGEACALLVGEEGERASDAPVVVAMSIDDDLRVRVTTDTPVPIEDDPHSDIDGVEPWALLRGLSDAFTVGRQGLTTTVSMTWSLA